MREFLPSTVRATVISSAEPATTVPEKYSSTGCSAGGGSFSGCVCGVCAAAQTNTDKHTAHWRDGSTSLS